MESNCSKCGVYKCKKGEENNLPKFCPMGNADIYEKANSIINSDENNKFYIESSKVEKQGYGNWPRVRETIELIKSMEYEKVGLAFCYGFRNEAKILSEIFERHNIKLVSVMCKTGGTDKCCLGLNESDKLKENQFEAGCNPLAQALILNEEKTDFNIVMGLCVGHDSLFYKYSDAFCTTLVVKDRVTGHNPIAAIYGYDGYFKSKLFD